MGCVPVLSAAYGSLRSCECLLESKFVKRDESGMNEHSGWETASSLSSDHQSRDAGEILLSWHTNTHAHSHDVNTHVHVHLHKKQNSWDSSREPQPASVFHLHCQRRLLDRLHFSPPPSHFLHHQPHSDRPQQWRHGVKQNLTKPLQQRGAIGIRALLTRTHLNQHTDIYPLTRREVMRTVCKFKFFLLN